MKKLFYLLIVTAFLGILLVSCVSNQSCPAYEDYKSYKIERPF